MNVLITGGNGQLGNELRLVSSGSQDQYIFTDVNELDITDAEAVGAFVRSCKAGVIVNCAAYTDVGKAEDNPELAERLNSEAAGNLARAAAETGALLIHISTDYVFGAGTENQPCSETLAPNPCGVYGLTKLHGERAVAGSGCRHIILRTAWLYSEFGKNFVRTMLSLTQTKPSLTVVYDQIGTPTYAWDLAKAIVGIIESRKFEEGIYHYSNEGVCSWFDFAKAIARLSGHTGCDIRPCLSSEYPSNVRRPFYSLLDKSKFKRTFAIKIPYWLDSLEICVKNLTTKP